VVQYTNSYALSQTTTPVVTLANAITRTGGYRFDGWVSGGVKYAAGATVPVAANATFTASWVAVPLTVTYDYAENGGTSATVTTAQVPSGTAVPLTVTASKPGWVFVGWNTNRNATAGLSSYRMPTSDATLYAIYRQVLTVTLQDSRAGTRTVSVTIYNKATSGRVTIPSVRSYSGWTARGWTTSTVANAPSMVSSGAYTLTENMTFYALYQRSFTVTFNAGGGTPTPARQTVTTFTNSAALPQSTQMSVILPAAPTRNGYTFDGWLSSSGGTKHTPGATVPVTVNTTFTATWLR